MRFRVPVPGRYPLAAFLLLALLAFDAGSLDLRLAEWFGGPQGFPLRDNWWLTTVLHNGGRNLAWAVGIVLIVAVWRPFGVLRRLDRVQRAQLALSTLAAVLLVSLMKSVSTTSCPWDLSTFGGIAHHISHWRGLRDGGGGHCFPAGHASSGFAFLGGWLVFRDVDRGIARRWLLASLTAGFVLGLAQQARGAHFMSHTLWTAWLCWAVALAFDAVRGFVWERSPARIA
jgi:membrane-associated PAP2 superfamily phosphatase